jgi:hypothetical protein
VRLCPRNCQRRTAIYFSRRPSSLPHSRPTWTLTRPRSWPTLKFRGGLEGLNGAVGKAAWRTKASWYLISTDDKMIPPAAQR